MKNRSRRKLVTLISLGILLAGVITVFALARTARIAAAEPDNGTSVPQTRNYVTTNSQGSLIAVERATGKFMSLTQDESERLASGLSQLINKSAEGLVEVRNEDGMVSMDLQGRFQSVLVARKDTEGTVSAACIDDLDAAASFFEIDPQLLGLAGRKVAPTEMVGRASDR